MNMFVSAARSSRSKDATGGVVRGMGFGGGERSHSARRTLRALDDVLFAFVRDRKYVILQFMRNEVEPTIWSVHYMLMPNLYAMRYHIARWRHWRRRCRSRVAAVEGRRCGCFFSLFCNRVHMLVVGVGSGTTRWAVVNDCTHCVGCEPPKWGTF